MKSDELLKLLQAVESGNLISEAALAKLKHLPFEDIGFARWTITARCARGTPK